MPVGNGCLECKIVVSQILPAMTFEAVIVIAQKKGDESKSILAQISGGRAMLKVLEESTPAEVPVRFPQSEVSSTTEFGASLSIVNKFSP